MDSNDVLYVIALASIYGEDAALAEAIERGLISPDQHVDSDDYEHARKSAEAF